MKTQMSRTVLLRIVLLLLYFVMSLGVASASETITYFHNDISGSPAVATDASGSVVWKENYRPYGDKLNNQSASGNNKLWFAGKPYDRSTGLSYMGARYYDPVLGRFMSVDPKDFDPNNIHSFNRYTYANNNPYKFVDPDGHSPIDVAFLIYDLGKLGVAVYTGAGIGAAAADVAFSAVGAASPVPGAGQALKAARAGEQALDVGVQANKAAGDAFEQQVMGQLQQVQSGVVQQVTVKTQSGVRTRIDLMGRDANGNIVCTECKASAIAPLTRNQAAAFPEIQQSGAVVVGKGKPGFPGSTQIPPTTVDIIRP